MNGADVQKHSASGKRKGVLLRAAYDLLTQAERCSYVLETGAITTWYDDAECGGDCLRIDIASELDIDDETDPIEIQEAKA